MRIKFNGVLEKKTKGCKCKGGSKTTFGFTMSKMYILPSGRTQTFYKDQVVEVNDKDGEFLLSYKYNDVNGYREAFSRVD